MFTIAKEIFPYKQKFLGMSAFANWANRLLKTDLSLHLATRLIQHAFVLHEENNIEQTGIYQYTGNGLNDLSYCPADEPLNINTRKPVLLFIHGTISNSVEGFSALWDGNAKGDFDKLLESYDRQVFFFDHYTLSQSPIDNALEIAKAFPPQTRFHIISHSRGGLIGELLCQSRLKRRSRYLPNRFVETNEIFSEEELVGFLQNKSLHSDYQNLKELQSLYCQKHFLVERFIRVAAPIRGTLLASGNLEACINTICSAINTLPLPHCFGVTSFIRNVLLKMIKQLKSEAIVPGISSMKPDAPLIKLLNRPGVRLQNELTVVSGVAESKCWTAKLTGLIFKEQHDYVVNTQAMYGGCRRTVEINRNYHEQGSQINHFLYFTCDNVKDKLKRALQLPIMLITSQLDETYKVVPEYMKNLRVKTIALIKNSTGNFFEDCQNAEKFAPDKRLIAA